MKNKILISILLCLFLLTSCSEKTPLDAKSFKELAEEQGYTVTEGEAQDEKVMNAYMAVKDNITVQFWITENSEHADSIFEASKTYYKEDEDIKITNMDINVSNYKYCSFSGEEKYYIIACVEDTYAFCVTKNDNKDQAIEFFEAIGYK